MFYLPSDLINTINNEKKDKKIVKLNTYLTYLYGDLLLDGKTILIDLCKFINDFINKTNDNSTKITKLYIELNKIISGYENVILVSNEIRNNKYIYFYGNIIKYIINNTIEKNCILIYFRYPNDLIKQKLIEKISKNNNNIKLYYNNTIDGMKYDMSNLNYHIQIYNNINLHEYVININFDDFIKYI
jgi:hypothetical protein